MTQRPENRVWTEIGQTFTHSYVNERNASWTYDADGNLTSGNNVNYTIDAAGETSRFVSLTYVNIPGQPIGDAVTLDTTQGFDGDGKRLKNVAVNTVHTSGGDQTTTHTTHLVRSSVLGGKVISEIGTETNRTFVYLGSSVLAVQNRNSQTVTWEERDPGSASVRMTLSNGNVSAEGNAELDPLGSDAGLSAPPTPSPATYWKITVFPGFGNSINNLTCVMDGMPTPCSEAGRAMNTGSADWCPENNCGPRHVIDPNGREHLVPLMNIAGRLVVWVPNEDYETPDDLWGRDGGYIHLRTRELRIDPDPQKPKAPHVDQSDLGECLKTLFGVDLLSFTESRDGSNGSFTGFGPDRLSNSGNNAQIDIVNEVNAYTSLQLKQYYNAHVPPGTQPLGPNDFVKGQTRDGGGYSAYRNFTASNLKNSLEILKTQVHELGHSLQHIVGTNYAEDLGGQKLEDCVNSNGGFKTP